MESSNRQETTAADESKKLQRVALIGFGLGCLPVVSQLLIVSPLPSGFSLALNEVQELIVVPALLVSFFAFVGALAALPFRRWRSKAMPTLRAGIYISSSILIGFGLCQAIRTEAFSELTLRSAPIVDAIVKFNMKNLRPPNNLSELVPEFLPKVPDTGMGAYPAYEYELLVKRESPWELRVYCSTGILNIDRFFYWPTQNYPLKIYGGRVELINDWAYVHE